MKDICAKASFGMNQILKASVEHGGTMCHERLAVVMP